MRKLFVILVFLPVLAHTQSIVWENESATLNIGDRIEILEDKTGKLTYEQVSSVEFNGNFIDSDKVNLSLGYTESFFWLRCRIDNQSLEPVILEVAQAGLPEVDLYYKSPSGDVFHKLAGYRTLIKDKEFKNSFQLFSIPVGKTDVYIRLNSNSEPIPIRLCTRENAELNFTGQKMSYGIYLGLMLFAMLNNLFFFLSLRNRMYLYYSFIVLLYISYSAAVIDGFIIYFFPNIDLLFFYTTIPTIGVTLQTLYCLLFLEAKKYVPKLYKVILGIVIYFGCWAVIKFFFSFPVVQPINTINALISFFVMGYVGIKVGKKGNKLGYYFALAYFIYFVLVAMQAVYINTGSPAYLGGLSHVAYATLIEAFILSFLLSKRTDWEKEEIEKEKLRAQEKTLETIRENERIVQEQNIRLEEEVTKRTEELYETNLELHAANDQLTQSNEENLQANQLLIVQKHKLEHQHAEMEKLISTKDRFFSIISHDLRGPVSSFMGLSYLLKQSIQDKDYDQLLTISNMIDKSSSQLSNLLDNLLNWAVNQKGEFPYTPEKVELMPIVVEVTDIFLNMANSKGITLEADIEMGIHVWVDKNSVMTILRNLVNNAIKFTNKGGRVSISATETDETVSICVKDNGLGMSKEKLDSLFKIKDQESTWGTEGEKGLGLGLQLAHEFSILNKGSIQVLSEEGEGTTFIVELPKTDKEQEVGDD